MDRNAAKKLPDPTPGPWNKWTGSYAGRTIRFIETYCRSPKGVGYGQPLRLAPWQKEEIETIYADGVDAAVLSFPRGNGKSVLQAGLAVAGTFMDHETGAPDVPIIATTIAQAMRSVYDNATSMVRSEPELSNRCVEFTGWGSTKVVVPSTGGRFYPMSNEQGNLQGLDPSLAIADEIGFQPPASWGSLRQAGGKRTRSLVLGMGTPGVDDNNALYMVRDKATTTGIRGLYFREWAADVDCDPSDREQWRKANPAIGSGFLQEKALESDFDEYGGGARFRIFRLGQWVEGFESWLGDDGYRTWNALEDPYTFVKDAPTWVGVDAAITRDTTAVVAVQVRPDGRLHAKARFWVPRRDEPTDLSDVMTHIRNLANEYRVGSVAYDPRFLDWPAKILHDEGIPMVEISQAVERMTPIIGDLHRTIFEAGLTHEHDPMLRSHVLDAVARHHERGFTLKKADSRGHIDGCIALALAVSMYRGKRKERPKLFLG